MKVCGLINLINLNMWISRIFKEFIKLTRLSVFVDRCKLCEADLVVTGEALVCGECLGKIYVFKETVCAHCGRPMWNGAQRCGECIVNPPSFLRHRSYGGYREELKDLILKFKYGRVEALKHLLAGYYLEVFRREIAGPFDFIIPVPPDRGRKREFDPVSEIGKVLSKRLGKPLLTGSLVKTKKTEPQAGLSRSRRLNNLNRAFTLTKKSRSFEGKIVLLLDDVYTTGTTIKKCTEILTKAGADVVALTLARSI